MSLPVSLLIGFLLSSLIGFVAYRRGALTRSGVVGAILTGTAIFGFGGFVSGLLLVSFFVSSTLLSRYKSHAKQEVSENFQKGSQRDLGQALANGGWAALLAIAGWYANANSADDRIQSLLFAGFVGAMAAVTADTWATEIGVLSKDSPRMITTGRVVPAGTSGAITALGTLVAFMGALFIGVLGSLVRFRLIYPDTIGVPLPDWEATFLQWLPAISYFAFLGGIGGLAGALFDSLLGATVQAIYFSEYEERQTEKKLDSEGLPTIHVRGWIWLDNDWVNFFASVFGSLIAVAVAFLIL